MVLGHVDAGKSTQMVWLLCDWARCPQSQGDAAQMGKVQWAACHASLAPGACTFA